MVFTYFSKEIEEANIDGWANLQFGIKGQYNTINI